MWYYVASVWARMNVHVLCVLVCLSGCQLCKPNLNVTGALSTNLWYQPSYHNKYSACHLLDEFIPWIRAGSCMNISVAFWEVFLCFSGVFRSFPMFFLCLIVDWLDRSPSLSETCFQIRALEINVMRSPDGSPDCGTTWFSHLFCTTDTAYIQTFTHLSHICILAGKSSTLYGYISTQMCHTHCESPCSVKIMIFVMR